MEIDRLQLVRRLLGTATQLFLDDSDPLSVHCLAASAMEHAEYAAKDRTGTDFKEQIMITFPDLTEKGLKRLRNRHWRVIKHSHDLNGLPFDVTERLADFDDSQNDGVLFAGWYDFMSCGRPIPIAAQVLQMWYFRVYPESLNPEKGFDFRLFDGIHELTRIDQKRLLRQAVRDVNRIQEISMDSKTDSGPLVLPIDQQPYQP